MMAADVARAVRWARDNASRLGADPSRLLLCGHSAGAHLAAIVATDPRFLEAVGMATTDLEGVVGISGPYSVRMLVEETSAFVSFAVRFQAIYHAFGRDRALWELSDPGRAAAEAARRRGAGGGEGEKAGEGVVAAVARPAFVLLIGEKEVQQSMFEAQMRSLAEALKASGHDVRTAMVPGKSHTTMVSHLGAGAGRDTISLLFLPRFGVSSSARRA